jgi:L-aspartate oxidase
LECFVFGERLAEQVCSQQTQIFNVPKAIAPILEEHGNSETILNIKSAIQNLSWQAAGICRVQSELEIALTQICTWQAELTNLAEPSRLWIETRNLADYAYLLMRSALFRTESRGAHYRSDFPDTDPKWQLHTIIEGQEIRRSPDFLKISSP